MSGCHSEETYSVYVDGELPAEEVRAVESHLVGCETCRGLILAYRDEAAAIADLVLDRRDPRRHARVVRAPARVRARGVAIGVVPTLGVAALVVAAWGWLMEFGLPTGLGWLNPMKPNGVYEMMFDTVLMLREDAPAFFEFAIAAGAMVSVASILTFLVSAFGRRIVGTSALLLIGSACLLMGPEVASALERRTSEADMRVASSETIDENLIISGESVTVDGTVDGDLAAFGERVILRGLVKGDVFAAGEDVEVLGTIEGTLHVAGKRVMIEAEVERSIYGAGKTVTLHERGEAGRDATLFGETVLVDGRVGRDLVSAAREIELRGPIGRNAATRSEDLTLHDSTSVGGNLDYALAMEHEPEIAAGAKIAGTTTVGEFEHEGHRPRNRWVDGRFYMHIAVILVSAFLVGMLLHVLFPDLFLADLESTSDFFRSMGYGALAMIGVPVVLVLCFVTVVGIPLGIIGVFFYVTMLFVSMIAVGSLVGTPLAAMVGFDPDDNHGFGIALLVGLIVVLVAMNLPFVGGIFRLLVVATGLGMIIDSLMHYWRTRGEDAYLG